MRVFLCIVTGSLTLGLGVTTSWVQSKNHELAARLDARQTKYDLTNMFILSAEATVLSAEASPMVPVCEQLSVLESVQ